MAQISSLPVLIVGAGPSGLVTALSLLQSKVPVRIIDKRTEPGVGWKGAGIHPRSQELYRLLDILPDIWEKSYQVPVGKRVDLDSGATADFFIDPPSEPSPPRPYHCARFLDQSHHEGLLRAHLEKFSCFVEFGTGLEGLEQKRDHVTAELLKSNGEKLSATFSYVVGADGGKGITRKLLGLKFYGDTYASRGIFADVAIDGGLERNIWHLWASREKSLTMTSLCYSGHDNTFGFFYIAKSEEQLPKTPDDLLKTFCSETGRTDIEFAGFRTFNDWTPNVRMVKQFSTGRVFLVGDAAHIHSPAGGQGMNSSIQDAHNLAWKIAFCHLANAHPSLLSSYDGERRPVITQMLGTTTGLLKASTTADTAAFERTTSLHMLGINYRGSSIVLDERNPQSTAEGNDYYDTHDGLLRAGDRAPEASGLSIVECAPSSLFSIVSNAQNLSLFDLFRGTRHVILTFGIKVAVLEALRTLVAKTIPNVTPMIVYVLPKDISPGPGSKVNAEFSGADLLVQDTQGYAVLHYGVDPDSTDETMFIVRPDGIVGAVVQSGVTGVERYFNTLLGRQE